MRSFANKTDDLNELLEVLDYIDKWVEKFKTRYKVLKEKMKEGKAKSKVDKLWKKYEDAK